MPVRCLLLLLGMLFAWGCFPEPRIMDYRTRPASDNPADTTPVDPYRPLGLIKDDTVRITPAPPRDPLLVLLKKYSPDAYTLVRRTEQMLGTIRIGRGYAIMGQGEGTRTITMNGVTTTTKLTNKGFRKWISPNDSFDKQFKDIPTAVHELFHGHTHRNAPYLLSRHLSDTGPLKVRRDPRSWVLLHYDTLFLDQKTIHYSLTRSTGFYVPCNRALRASVLTNTVPPERRTFRWKTYVSGSVYQSTMTSGISGLLDEYAAYYWSTKVAFDFFGYYRTEQGGTARAYRDWANQVVLYYFAWAEFRSWILEYFAYTEKHHPAIWKSFLSDQRLREGFTAVDDRFTALVAAFFDKLLRELPALLAPQGLKVYLSPYLPRPGSTGKPDLTYVVDRHSTTLMYYYFLPLREEMAAPRLTRIANLFRTRPQGILPVLPFPEKRQELKG